MPDDALDDLTPDQKQQVADLLEEAADILGKMQDRLDAIEQRMADFDDVEQRLAALENEPVPRTLPAGRRLGGTDTDRAPDNGTGRVLDGLDVDAAGRFGR